MLSKIQIITKNEMIQIPHKMQQYKTSVLWLESFIGQKILHFRHDYNGFIFGATKSIIKV